MSQDLTDLAFLHRKSAPKPGDAPPSAMQGAPSPGGDAAQDKCPVDHKSREAWLAQARAASASAAASDPAAACPVPHSQPPAAAPAASSSSSSWWRLPSLWSSPSSSSPAPRPPATPAASLPPNHPSLDTYREISTIPRSSAPGPSACPVNNEAETGADPATGNWIYPSEKMFFEAMRRKGHGAEAADMRTVVPIHNAVNERAWAEIKEWERPYAGENTSCPGGPRLHSFMGLSKRMSPKARINTLLGYTEPFDRHDWVVDRCGTQVEYVIDFYAGSSRNAGGKVNFYLDVRPKLNTWEGVKMRAARALGLV